MMKGLLIRHAFATDVPGILVCLESLAEVGCTVHVSQSVFICQLRCDHQPYVALIGDEVVGTATLLLQRKFIHGGGLAARIEDVAVRRDKQRQGIGTALVQELVRVAKELGMYKITLACSEVNAGFYTRLGFRCHEIEMRMEGK